MNRELNQLQHQLHLQFHNQSLLRQAFTHSSYVNEHRTGNNKDNERLEFLGDAVLELTVSQYLFETYPQRSEGELTKLRAAIVCEPSLVTFAEQLEFGRYVMLGKGEELTGGRTRPALLADVFEAFIGALYLDQGLEQVQAFLQRHFFPKIEQSEQRSIIDYKTELQEYIQQNGLGNIEYRIINEIGPEHEKKFVTQVWIDQRLLGDGAGRSKKEAEQKAASQALQRLQVRSF